MQVEEQFIEREPELSTDSELLPGKNVSFSLNMLSSPQSVSQDTSEIRRRSTIEVEPIRFIKEMAHEAQIKEENESRIVEESFDDASLFPGYVFKNQDPSDLEVTKPSTMLANMTSEQLQEFRGGVIAKYGKDGRSRGNVDAPKERRNETKKFELLHYKVRISYKESIAALLYLTHEITDHMNTKLPPFASSMKLEIEQTQPLANLSSFLPKELQTIPEELESFCLPKSPFLLTHPNFRKLHGLFLQTRATLIDAITAISKYEIEIIPLYRELTIMQASEDKVRERELELQKQDLVDGAEKIIRKQISREANHDFKKASYHSSRPLVSESRVRTPILTREEDAARKARVEKKMKVNLEKIRKTEEDRVNTINFNLAKKNGNLKKLEEESQRIKKYLKFPEIPDRNSTRASAQELARAKFIEEREIQEESRYRQQITEERKRSFQQRLENKQRLDAALNFPVKKQLAKLAQEKPKARSGERVSHEDLKFDLESEIKEDDPANVDTQPDSGNTMCKDESTSTLGKVKERRIMPIPRETPKQSVPLEFSTTLFYADPSTIFFDDYVPGKTYKLSFHLTNISCVVNAFQLLPLSDDVSEIFQIEYKPPGRMSAGMTTGLTLKFTPPEHFDQDISSLIIAKAESGGAFKIPFGCRKQKCSPYIVGATSDSIQLDFGSIVVGSIDTRVFVLKNRGALNTDFDIFGAVGENFTIKKTNGNLGSKDAIKVEVTFNPSSISSSMSCHLIVQFAEDVEPIYVNCTGESIASPLNLKDFNVDFGICDFNQDYGKVIQLTNSSAQSLKFNLSCTSAKIPTAVQAGNLVCKLPNGVGYIKVISKAIIQGCGSFPIRLQFKPSENASKNLALFSVPLAINYSTAGVACKIDFVVSGSTTNASVSFEFENNFKVSCSIYEQIELPIAITNHSHLSQSFKPTWDCKEFSLRSTLTQETIDKSIHIKPQQQMELCIIFKPEEIKQYDFSMQFKSERGKLFNFKGIGIGFRPQVRFNNNVLNFPSTSLGSMNNIKVSLIHEEPPNEKPNYYPWIKKERAPDSGNHGEIKYEFLSPEIKLVGNSDLSENDYTYNLTDQSPVMVFPSNGTFARSSSSVIDLIVSPSLLLASVKDEIDSRELQIETDKREAIETAESETRLEQEKLEMELAAANAAAPKKKGAKPTKEKVPEVVAPVVLPTFKPIPPMDFFTNFKESTAYVTIPCRITSGKTDTKRNSDFINGDISDSSKNEKIEEMTQVRLVFDIVSPEFVFETWPIDSPIEDRVSSLLHGSLRFQMVPIGQCLYKSIIIRNVKDHEIKLQSSMLNPQGPFYLAKSLRTIEAKGSYELRLSFEPRIAGKYQTTFDISCGSTSTTIILIGEAVIPQIDIQPDVMMDFPQLILGDDAVRSFTVTNPCHFPITLNANAVQSGQFEISPQSAVIAPRQEQTISVKFCPVIEDSDIKDILTLSYWGMNQEETIELLAKSWGTGAVVSGYDRNIDRDEVSSIIAQVNEASPVTPLEDDAYRFIECSCNWQSIETDGGAEAYAMEPKSLELLNLKPEVLKMENVGKNIKTLAVQYTIEKIFIGTTEPAEYCIELDSLGGSIDQGSKKSLQIRIANTVAIADSGASKKSKKPSEMPVLSTSTKFTLVNYFRVSLKGGYQGTEPKGIAEQREWVLKVTIE